MVVPDAEGDRRERFGAGAAESCSNTWAKKLWSVKRVMKQIQDARVVCFERAAGVCRVAFTRQKRECKTEKTKTSPRYTHPKYMKGLIHCGLEKEELAQSRNLGFICFFPLGMALPWSTAYQPNKPSRIPPTNLAPFTTIQPSQLSAQPSACKIDNPLPGWSV